MGYMGADKLIGVSSSWAHNGKWMNAYVGQLITAINPYKEVLLEGSKKTLDDCSGFLKDKKWNDTEGICSPQNVNDIYEVLRDISDVSADLFSRMSVSRDVQKYLDGGDFENIFRCYVELYDFTVKEIENYETQGKNRNEHNFAGAVAHMYGALQNMNDSYGLVTRDVSGNEKSLAVPK
ncbi:MAG: hypothetical protein KAH93_00440 [Candidatus Aenigmarchaeota archaeon]|nr:hypothetical protein [Candidatus Aenigmarchaeota archaeon]